MDKLYRYFLYLIKRGFELFDAIARAATKFADIPAKEMYNVAVSAYASRAAGQWMEANEFRNLGSLLNTGGSVKLSYGITYTYEQLLDLFPTLVAPPFQFIGAGYSQSKSISGYKTFSTYIDEQGYYHKIIGDANMLFDYKYKVVGTRLVFVAKFIVGRPILVDY